MKRFLSSLFFMDNGYPTASQEEYEEYLKASSLQEKQQSFPEEGQQVGVDNPPRNEEIPLTQEEALEILQNVPFPLILITPAKVVDLPPSHHIIEAILLVGYPKELQCTYSVRHLRARNIVTIPQLVRLDNQYGRQSLSDYRDYANNTILHKVVAHGDSALRFIIDILNHKLVDCNARNHYGQSPLHLAITNYATETIKELCEYTTDIEIWREFFKEKNKINTVEDARKIVRSAQTTLETFEIQYVGLFNIHLTTDKFTHIYETLNTNKKFVEALFTLPVESLLPIVETWSGYHEPGSLSRAIDHVITAVSINMGLEKNYIPEIILFFLENKQFLNKIQDHPWRVNFIERIAQSRVNSDIYQDLEAQKNSKLQSIRTPRENKEILDKYFSVMRQTIIDTIKSNLNTDRNTTPSTFNRLGR